MAAHRRTSSTSRTPQSLEALLDEENREVLASLGVRRTASPDTRRSLRTATPPAATTRRTMLDYDRSPSSSPRHPSAGPRHGSIPSIFPLAPTSLRPEPSSKLDPTDPSTWTRAHSSKPSSAVPARKTGVTRPRGVSDVGTASPSGEAATATTTTTGDILSGEHVGQPAALSHRHNSTTATGQHSRSPSGRIAEPGLSSADLLSPTSGGQTGLTAGQNDGRHGSVSVKSSSFSTTADEAEETVARIPMDQVPEDEALESSDEDESSGSEDESRGRSRYSGTDSEGQPATPQPSSSENKDQPAAAAAPSEQRQPHSQVIKSLLEPSIKVTSPTRAAGQHSTHLAAGSHLKTRRPSNSTMVSDDGEANAIAKAKSLGLNISPLDTTVAERHVRMIIRGDWAGIHAEAEAGDKTVRTYLACTDLSQEATYALEWTVGTIMRDGDTLLAIYSIEDETSGSPDVGVSKNLELEKEKLTSAGAQAGKEASDVMESLTRQVTNPETPKQSKFVPATELESLTGSVDARKVSKKEMERLKAIDEITQTFLRFVRKTTLQVRCMIEVIHCKSPKHLILGAIDELDPTLTVVGTRGRSSLKGVLLGSFSNYLVTKSSSPVMVARRKPKKPKAHGAPGARRLSNNLTTSLLPRKSLTQARID